MWLLRRKIRVFKHELLDPLSILEYINACGMREAKPPSPPPTRGVIGDHKKTLPCRMFS